MNRDGANGNGKGRGLVLYPSLDLRHGHPAQTIAGPREGPPTPEEQAKALRQAGATWVQVIDLDAALGEHNQWPQLTRLLDGRLRIQFGGGVRSMTQVQQLLDLGVERVIVGTQAIRNPLWARELAHIFAGRIVLALDARGRDLVVQGRTEPAGLDIVATARALDDAGLNAFLYTEVDGKPDPAIVAELRLAAPRTPLFVGGHFTLDDLAWLDEAGAAGAVQAADGANGSGGLDLAEALRRYPAPATLPLLQVLRAREESGMGVEGEEE